jgi:hypothetical protein
MRPLVVCTQRIHVHWFRMHHRMPSSDAACHPRPVMHDETHARRWCLLHSGTTLRIGATGIAHAHWMSPPPPSPCPRVVLLLPCFSFPRVRRAAFVPLDWSDAVLPAPPQGHRKGRETDRGTGGGEGRTQRRWGVSLGVCALGRRHRRSAPCPLSPPQLPVHEHGGYHSDDAMPHTAAASCLPSYMYNGIQVMRPMKPH